MTTNEWRLIPLETVSAAWAMALEEVLIEGVASGGPPTLRFWRWDPSAATIGRFQDVDAEVDLEYCHLHGIDVVRRMSGGGAVFHDWEGEFVYSVTAPEDMFPRGVVEAYRVILERVIAGLEGMDLEAWVKDDNNLMVGDRKVSGNSQRRSRGVLQVHGTVLVHAAEETMFSVLKARAGQPVEGRATPSRHHPVAGLTSLCEANYQDLYDVVRRSLLAGEPAVATSWTEAELTAAEGLVANKYSLDTWNLFL
ncbi:MAG: lipoate--protein ligase family protein [Thermoplasmata archaeon]|nr:lipoate--protein ligase family protein [Thermoplasmata archaeon]NIS13652.1 lipoate--protein ligase family protein [Thermoplasmata archaeon]NIS21524.1 lipoate--protein ligase family protein [Thermoplasmata archaeon]NIT79090.1 lipoate--protein ligase family protein [Thermoplasmata archaeon]NIU50570.1 lipoate--protein ligase family protein [Thermoplasmata archaeon]